VNESDSTAQILHTAIRNLATQVNRLGKQVRSNEVRKATVVAVNYSSTGITADVNLSGDTSVVVPALNVVQGVSPAVGDTVNVLKQGPTMVVASQVGAPDTGWVTPTLGTGFSHNGDSGGSVQYRLINDQGSMKMQWQGVAAVTGSNTSVLSAALPSQYRPSAQRKLITARGMGNGNAFLDVQVQFTTSGTVVIQGNTYTFPAHVHSLGTSATENAAHDHDSYNPEDGLYYLSTTENESHAHAMGNSTGTSGATALPDWISFNGLEYFL
jgi:hypothetical protein